MTTSADPRPDPVPSPRSRPGSGRWFTPEQEAENCARQLGQRRHGLDSMLPPAATPASSRTTSG